MTEHPKLLRGDMMRAALLGAKTQTRVPVKPQPRLPLVDVDKGDGSSAWTDLNGHKWRCPFGIAGDVLWCRETWRAEEVDDGVAGIRYRADDRFVPTDNTPEAAILTSLVLWIDVCQPVGVDIYRWRPSVHMPRWACRQLLTVLRVWVERVQDISEDDAEAEGLTEFFWPEEHAELPHIAKQIADGTRYWEHATKNGGRPNSVWDDPRRAYQELIAGIYGPGLWADNAWMWACEFERRE